MNAPKSSTCRIVAICALIGCGVLAYVALIEHIRTQQLQRKLGDDERDLEFIRTIPGWKQIASSQAHLRQENPEKFKQTQEMLRQMPAKMKEHREAQFQARLSNIQERAKMTVPPAEAAMLKEIVHALAEVHDLESNREEMVGMLTADVLAGVNARKALDQLHERYIDIRLQELAERFGRHDSAELKKFAADVKQAFVDADSLVGPRMFASSLPVKSTGAILNSLDESWREKDMAQLSQRIEAQCSATPHFVPALLAKAVYSSLVEGNPQESTGILQRVELLIKAQPVKSYDQFREALRHSEAAVASFQDKDQRFQALHLIFRYGFPLADMITRVDRELQPAPTTPPSP